MASELVLPRRIPIHQDGPIPAQQPKPCQYTSPENTFNCHPPQTCQPPVPLGDSAPASPMNSSSTNSSPTSPRSYYARQIRPNYMPAVLRPNEYQARRLSSSGSDGAEDQKPPDQIVSRQNSNNVLGPASINSFMGMFCGRPQKALRFFEDEDDLDHYPTVTDMPTRQHWKVIFPPHLLPMRSPVSVTRVS